MCLVLFAYRTHLDYSLILAANRDEFYERPTAPARFWEQAPGVLAGRDLRHGGTWLGIDRRGRFAAITNYRNPAAKKVNPPSRGLLVSRFLLGKVKPVDYLREVHARRHRFETFNLLVGDLNGLYYYSSRTAQSQLLNPGVYGLSNYLLDSPWPKVETGKFKLNELVSTRKSIDSECLFSLLAERYIPPDEALPDTGIGIEWERILSPPFIQSPTYGTRSSTVLLISTRGTVTFTERSFDENGDESTTRACRFEIQIPRQAYA